MAQTFSEFDAAAARMPASTAIYSNGGRRREYRGFRLEWLIKSGKLPVV